MSKHTPGPWQLSEYEDGHAFVFDRDMSFIANINCGDDHGKANVQLIAESPAMLDALQKIETILARNLYHQTEKCEDALTIARTAIAKATGAT